MNLYRFFRDVACEYLGAKELSRQEVGHYRDIYMELAAAYTRGEPVDYSDEHVRIAYLLSFAPRHAVYWREFIRADIQQEADFDGYFEVDDNYCAFNVLGVGPGSEIVGLLSGIDHPGPLHAIVACRESEADWIPILEIVQSQLTRHGDLSFEFQFVATNRELYEDVEVLGSYVLSDLARQGCVQEFLKEVGTVVSPKPGFFLDTMQFNDGGAGAFIDRTLRESGLFRRIWSEELGKHLDLPRLLASEHASGGAIGCQCLPSKPPRVLAYKVRFR